MVIAAARRFVSSKRPRKIKSRRLADHGPARPPPRRLLVSARRWAHTRGAVSATERRLAFALESRSVTDERSDRRQRGSVWQPVTGGRQAEFVPADARYRAAPATEAATMQVACRSGRPRARSCRIVVLGSACEAASGTWRSGTPAPSAAVMNACLSVRGVTGLPVPARRATLRTTRPAPCRSGRRRSAARNTGPSVRPGDGQVHRPGGARCQRKGDDLAALSRDGQRPVPAFEAEVLDAGAGGVADPPSVQGQ